MRQYGFDAADLAYATGQTLAQVGSYLQQHGAADGFAGWSFSRGYVGSGVVPTVTMATTAATVSTPLSAAQSATMRTEADFLLADPDVEQLVRQFGGPLQSVPLQGLNEQLVATYGVDRLARMLQLQTALDAVRTQYAQAMQAAIGVRTEEQPGTWISTNALSYSAPNIARTLVQQGQSAAYVVNGRTLQAQQGVPGWQIEQQGTVADGTTVSVFNPQAYTAWYTAQSGAANQAFKLLHQGVGTTAHRIGGVQDQNYLIRTRTADGLFEFAPDTAIYLASGPVRQINTARPPELHDSTAVWFDPAAGFVTHADNIIYRESLLEQALPYIFAGVYTYLSAGALSWLSPAGVPTGAAAAGSLGGLAAAGGVGALGTAITQVVTTGNINLKDILKGALTSMVTFGIGQELGVAKWGLDNAGNVVSYTQRFLSVTSMSTLQGALSEITGGKFRDGFTASLASGVANEVVRAINLNITGMAGKGQISAEQASFMRGLSKTLGGAIKILALPDHPQYQFAADLIQGFLLDVIPMPQGASTANTAWSKVAINGLTIDDGWTLNPTVPGTGGFVPVQAAITGSLAIDSSAPAVPAVLLAGGVSANQVFGVRDSAGRLYYAIDGVDQLYAPTTFTDRAQAIVNQAGTGLANSSFTPSQVLEASRYLSAMQAAGAAPRSILIDVYVDGQWYKDPRSNSSASLTPTPTPEAVAAGGMISLGAVNGNGLRVLTNAIEVRETLTLAAPRLLPWTLLLVTGNAQEQVLNLNDSQRFVTRPGEVFGKMQQLGLDGQWHTSPNSVALVDIGSQRVALTQEELAWLRQPTTTPGTPLPPPPPLINVPLAPGELPSNLLPGQFTDQLAPSSTTTTPAEPVLTWEDLIITADGLRANTVGVVEVAVPNAENAVIDPQKVTGYALNPDHPRGGHKAIVFDSALGYNQTNAGDLIAQVQKGVTQNPATLGEADQFGQRYTVDMPITGPNGNTVTVRTGWILAPGSTVPRLVTIYVK